MENEISRYRNGWVKRLRKLRTHRDDLVASGAECPPAILVRIERLKKKLGNPLSRLSRPELDEWADHLGVSKDGNMEIVRGRVRRHLHLDEH